MDPPLQESMRPTSTYGSKPGYEEMLMGGEDGLCRPPALSNQDPQQIQPSHPALNFQALSKEDAQQVFIKYASEKCCYSKRPAEEGVITNMEAFSTYRYRLETYTETRTAEWSERPYFGELIVTDRQPPRPWEISIDGPPFFQDGSKIIEVPNSSSVKVCSNCSGMGIKTCLSCSGMRTRICISCSGRGHMLSNRSLCKICCGRGRTTCWACSATGRTICNNCAGKTQVVVAINLVVKCQFQLLTFHHARVNNIENYTVEQPSGLKMAKLGKVPGIEVFKDTNNMVYPVTTFPDQAIVQAAKRLHREHREKYLQTSRILQQRQTIELLPINKVTYEWRGESHVFFVYGTELKVSAEDYPAACCCCCCCCSSRCTVM